jgi:hypothetical protein
MRWRSNTEFSAAAVASAIGKETVEVEDCCEELARKQQFVKMVGVGEWPDGTIAGRYGFQHALYQKSSTNGWERHAACGSTSKLGSAKKTPMENLESTTEGIAPQLMIRPLRYGNSE